MPPMKVKLFPVLYPPPKGPSVRPKLVVKEICCRAVPVTPEAPDNCSPGWSTTTADGWSLHVKPRTGPSLEEYTACFMHHWNSDIWNKKIKLTI
jgi:hypothetical protein